MASGGGMQDYTSHDQPRVLLIRGADSADVDLGSALRGVGLMVQISRSGKEGVRTSQIFRPQLVVIDVTLSDTSGLDVLAQLRLNAGSISAIVLSKISDESGTVHVLSGWLWVRVVQDGHEWS